MSYTVASQGPRSRPATVTAASSLLYAAAVIEIIGIVIAILSMSSLRSVLDKEFAGQQDADLVGSALTVGLIVGIVFAVVFAAGAVVLGVFVGKGKNPARIVTWVLAGIAVLCYGCGVAGNAASGALNNMGGASTPEADAMQKRIEDAVPGWQTAVSTTSSVLLLLIFLAVIILLALPASNEFFRKEQEVWVPPTWPGDAAGGQLPPPPAGTWPTQPPTGPPAPPAPPAPPQP